MSLRRLLASISLIVLASSSVARVAEPAKDAASADWPPKIARKLPPTGKPIDPELRANLRQQVDTLRRMVGVMADPDVAIFVKAVDYALRHDEFFDAKSDPAKAKILLELARSRSAELGLGKQSWNEKRGNVVQGYRSELDDSMQPYGLVIPEKFDLSKPMPLYVWLHGRGDTRCDLQFIASFLGDKPVGQILPEDAIVLHPFGRYCNGWKSAGEIDVLEAIADVKKQYPIDENRIVLAGFSMGGAGAWHMGAHYADRWCAVHAGAGFVDVKRYQNLTAENMPPWYEQKLWGLYDVPDYRRNLLHVPVLAYSGEEDKQKAAADIMVAELAAEGYDVPHLIGPKMGHKYHPEALADIHKRLAALVAKGRNPFAKRVSLQTKTLRYNKMFWVEALGLKQHWEDAHIDAEVVGPRSLNVTTKNIVALKLTSPWGTETVFSPAVDVMIDGEQVRPRSTGGELYLVRRGTGWKADTARPHEFTASKFRRKLPGLQGPIDDAFMSRFVVHAPTLGAEKTDVDRWAEFESAHFLDRWRMLMRGEAMTRGDVGNRVLWGTPQTNPAINAVLDRLPIAWNEKTVGMGDLTFDAKKVVPVLIYPDPHDPERYVVINSGLTFREGHDRTNSLQNPKLGDWAFIDVTEPPTDTIPGKVLATGFFDEEWRYVPTKP